MVSSTRYFYGKEQMKRDHRDEHPGCKVMWPWLKWCSNYRYASQLVGYALEDVAKWPEKEWRPFYNICVQYHDVTRYRSGARSAYINYRERFADDEWAFHLEECRINMDMLGEDDDYFEGRTYEEYVEHRWEHKQMVKAVNVLYAYGMFNKKTGQIELDNLKKLK